MKSKFIKDMFSNHDGTYSTKRTAGWVCLFCAMAVAGISLFKPDVNEVIAMTVFGGFMGGFVGAIGISSIDSKSYWSSQQNSNNNQPLH